jgi:hypothetical protein
MAQHAQLRIDTGLAVSTTWLWPGTETRPHESPDAGVRHRVARDAHNVGGCTRSPPTTSSGLGVCRLESPAPSDDDRRTTQTWRWSATSGAVTDRFGVGTDYDALTFAHGNHGYGPNLFYYLRHDGNGFSTFGTIATSGAVTDRFGVGTDYDALTFAHGNHGYGPNLFYYLRRDITGLTVTAPDGNPPHSLAQQGHYMMFALNRAGVPSVTSWTYLH